MADQSLTLMIVDDNRDNRDLLEDILQEDYTLVLVESGQACLDTLAETDIDLILLDANMPGINGFDVCRTINKSPTLSHTPVVFVSALDSTEERLRGYEAGAEDYITKPFEDDAIEDVVIRVLEQKVKSKEIEKQAKEAMHTAFQAMTNSAELGNIIQFLQASYRCKTVDTLAAELLNTTATFGLNCSLLFSLNFEKRLIKCAKGSIEEKVFERFHRGEKILDFGSRTLINESRISILVKNMPLNKADDYGRIKDNLTALIAGTEARCKALEIEHQLEDERSQGLRSVLNNSREKLANIETLVEKQKASTHTILTTINQKIEATIFSFGLAEDQEQAILSAIDAAVLEMNGLSKYSDKIETTFHGFVDELAILAEK